nr:MAG TPA: zinc transporter [Caudoviricetes sp.]
MISQEKSQVSCGKCLTPKFNCDNIQVRCKWR